MGGIASFAVTETLGTIGSYVAAVLFVVAGVYLATFADVSETSPLRPFLKPLRYVGLGVASFGIVLASAAYFKHVGAAACEQAWRQKNLEAQIADLRQDNNALRAAASARADEARVLAQQKRTADAKLAQWQEYAGTLQSSVAVCRRATRDDDRRLCELIGNAAEGCPASH